MESSGCHRGFLFGFSWFFSWLFSGFIGFLWGFYGILIKVFSVSKATSVYKIFGDGQTSSDGHCLGFSAAECTTRESTRFPAAMI